MPFSKSPFWTRFPAGGGVGVVVEVGAGVGVSVDVAVGTGVGVLVGVLVDVGVLVGTAAQVGRVMVLACSVTAAFRARARPFNVAPVLMVMDASARTFPMNEVVVSRVADVAALTQHITMLHEDPGTSGTIAN